jgi:hypothetical protein
MKILEPELNMTSEAAVKARCTAAANGCRAIQSIKLLMRVKLKRNSRAFFPQ